MDALNQARMAPAGQQGGSGIGSMLAPLKRGDDADDAGMPVLLALVRELGGRTTLSAADLDRLGEAQLNACQTVVTACMTKANDTVTAFLTDVCKRQGASDVGGCARDYEFKILDHQQDKTRELLKRIKPG